MKSQETTRPRKHKPKCKHSAIGTCLSSLALEVEFKPANANSSRKATLSCQLSVKSLKKSLTDTDHYCTHALLIYLYILFLLLRDNLVLLQVGFNSLSCEMQEEKPAYDSISLLGETNVFAYFYQLGLK